MVTEQPPLDKPPSQIEVPPAVAALAAGRPVRPLWENDLGGRAFLVGTAGPGQRFVKWTPAESGIDLAGERDRMAWAGAYTPVARPLDLGADETGSWLVTTALPGENAVSPRWLADPRTAVTAIGTGLRALHERLPVADCPFSWAASERVAGARRRATAGWLDPAWWHEEYQPLGVDGALALVSEIPPADRLVVCHGDACAPNTLLDEAGRWTAHVDLGDLGVADRWADLAVATWSAEWNFGPGWEDELLAAYGVAPDPDRTRYYRLLWDLGP